MATYGVQVNDERRLLARVVAEDADGADVAALLAVDSAITGEAPPAALRTAPGDVDADGGRSRCWSRCAASWTGRRAWRRATGDGC